MNSTQSNNTHCDLCWKSATHFQNLPCLKHFACQNCAATQACLGPAIPKRDFHTCPICVINADEDIELYLDDEDIFGFSFDADMANLRTDTPMPRRPQMPPPGTLKAHHEMHRKERQLQKDENSSLITFQSLSPTRIKNDPSTLENSQAARYLFENISKEGKCKELAKNLPRKKHLRGMAGPITPGAVQRGMSTKRPVVPLPKISETLNDDKYAEQNPFPKNKEKQYVNEAEIVSEMSVLNDASERPSCSEVPTTTVTRELFSTVQKPLKRNARGQMIPEIMSRYSTPGVLNKPKLSIEDVANTLPILSNLQTLNPPQFTKFLDQFSDDEDELDIVHRNARTSFHGREERSIVPVTPRDNAWTEHRRPNTPVDWAEEEEDEPEVERCTSPVKRLRCPIRSLVDDSFIHSSRSDDDDDSLSLTTRPDPDDFWDF